MVCLTHNLGFISIFSSLLVMYLSFPTARLISIGEMNLQYWYHSKYIEL